MFTASFLIDPVHKSANSSEHGKVVGPAVLVAPAYSASQNPSSSFVAHKWPATVSLWEHTETSVTSWQSKIL